MAANERAFSGWVIFSAPTASTASCTPVATACQARWNAVEAEAQAFSTLKTGIPPRPSGRRRNCPASISWPVIDPATALPK